MRTLLFVSFSLLVCGSAAMAQGKVATNWHCLKASEEHKFDVGDMPGHTYGIAQGTCDATSGDSSFAEKTGAFTEFQEAWKASTSIRGRFNVTMGNGDKVYYTYQYSGPTDPTKPLSNTWKIVGGTGKQKGIKGSGTCSGKLNAADGSGDWVCTGTYSMGK